MPSEVWKQRESKQNVETKMLSKQANKIDSLKQTL